MFKKYKKNIKDIKTIKKIYSNDIKNSRYNNKKIFFFNIEKIKQLNKNINIFNKDDFIEKSGKINFCELFYLTLLMESKIFTINFEYLKSLKIISEKINLTSLQKIILAKIILSLISNFENKEQYKEIDIIKLYCEHKLIKENINIKNNILSTLKYDINTINSKKLDEIYSDIINYFLELIFYRKAEYSEINKIWNDTHLNLEEFIINESIYKKLISFIKGNNMESLYYNKIEIKDDSELLKKIIIILLIT